VFFLFEGPALWCRADTNHLAAGGVRNSDTRWRELRSRSRGDLCRYLQIRRRITSPHTRVCGESLALTYRFDWPDSWQCPEPHVWFGFTVCLDGPDVPGCRAQGSALRRSSTNSGRS